MAARQPRQTEKSIIAGYRPQHRIMTRTERFKRYFRERPNLTKALVGGSVLAAGTILALKSRNKWLKRSGMTGAVAGAGGALGYGSEFYRRQKERARSLGHKVYAAGGLGKELALANMRDLPSEAIVHGVIDLPFSTAEGILARGIATRTGRISDFIGSHMHSVQRSATLATAPRVRKLQTRVVGASDQEAAMGSNLLSVLNNMPKGLRTQANDLSRRRALDEMSALVRRQGSNVMLTPAQMNEALDKAGLPRTVDMRVWLSRAMQEQSLFGRSL